MNNVELYHKSNNLQRRDVRQCLEENGEKIKWHKHGSTVIDVGCGDGGITTNILKAFLPKSCKKLVGCDISEKMIRFANAHHARDLISFIVLDIESDLPDQLRKKFDHAFSFYTLHWIKQQKIAFSNIYDLLVGDGDCLFLILGYCPLYEVWRELARAPRWKCWMKDVERFVSPYHDSQDPEKDIKTMMTTIGFSDMEIKCVPKVFIYPKIEDFKNFINAVNPFKFPLGMQEDFSENYLKLVRDMQLVDHKYNDNGDGSFNIELNYKHIVVYGKK